MNLRILSKLDLLSNTPKNFIFQKSSNKTIFGGFLSFIYILIVICLSFYYIVLFCQEKKYSIEYAHYEGFDNNENKIEEKYNPYFNIKFLFMIKKDNQYYEYEDPHFALINGTNNQTIPTNITLNLRFSDINIFIALEKPWEIEDDTCKYYLLLIYNGFILEHQKTPPLHQVDEDNLFYNLVPIEYKHPMIFYDTKKIVKYKADLGLNKLWNKTFLKKSEESLKIIGLINNEIHSFLLKDLIDDEEVLNINETEYTPMGAYSVRFDNDIYDEYSRTKKQIGETVAKIYSLSLSLYSILTFLLTFFYSSSFNNTKIIEKILNNSRKVAFKDKRDDDSTGLNNNADKTNSLLPANNNEENIISINDEKTVKLDDKNEQSFNNKHYEEIKLPKFRFYEYLYHNIYSGCCEINRQKIISKCNEIIANYYSIEYIIYNQIKLENLFKDYKWNDPELNCYENNNLIIDLKNLISLDEIE